MNLQAYYVLPVLAIILQGVNTLDINSHFPTFVKLCFLPRSPVEFNLSSLTADGEPSEFYVVFGNDVIQHKIFEILTEKKAEEASHKDFERMCTRADVENVDDKGVAFGNLKGFKNITSNYTCQASRDFAGILQCNFKSPSQKIEEETLTYFTIVNDNFIFEIDCFKSGQVGWALYSTTPIISEEDKKLYLAHAVSLGFQKNTTAVLYGNNCLFNQDSISLNFISSP